MTTFESRNISRCITPVQRALLGVGAPILEESVVARHKRHAKFGMLWRTVRGLLLGIAALVAFESIGGHWLRTLTVGAAGLLLGGLFCWLVSSSDLTWSINDYATYRSSNAVPAHVAALAEALEDAGVNRQQIQVEHLKNDPIVFIQEAESSWRYDLVIW
jgi:hypothetical protein